MPEASEPKRILVADDDPELLRAMSLRLKSEGYDVVCANDSYQALQFAHAKQPDLLLLDINMPAGDGFSVYERVRNCATLSSVPVIYFTGDKREWIDEEAREIGAFALLHKPFDTEDMLATIRSALEHSAAA